MRENQLLSLELVFFFFRTIFKTDESIEFFPFSGSILFN